MTPSPDVVARVAAEGIDVLLLLPGMDGTGELFDRFAAALRPELDVRILRYPADSPTGYASLTDRVMAELPSGRRYALLAESFSGPIAIEIAARSPDGLAALLLCCTFARSPRPWLKPLQPLLPVVSLRRLATTVGSAALIGRHGDSGLRAAFGDVMARSHDATLGARMRAVLNVDVTERLRAVTVPTLVLEALQDRVVPPSAAQLIRRLKPDAVHMAMDAPHFLLQTRPVEAAKAVEMFLAHIG